MGGMHVAVSFIHRAVRLVMAVAVLVLSTVSAWADEPAMQWQPVESLNAELPDAVRVFAGEDPEFPLRAWYVSVSPGSDSVRVEVLLSDDSTDRRERVSRFAADTGACVAVNGGFFSMERTPAMHAGLLVVDGVIEAPATRSVVRGDFRYETARAALGFSSDGFEIAWVTSRDGQLHAWMEPPAHRQGAPAELNGTAVPWVVEDAVGAGPSLVSNGQIDVRTDEEVFFGSAIPDTHPRTAAGITADGELLLVLVDGRQPTSRGVNLEELAALMVDIGAEKALNLDGGGSSSLVVNGSLVNRPVGRPLERQVMSAVGVFCE